MKTFRRSFFVATTVMIITTGFTRPAAAERATTWPAATSTTAKPTSETAEAAVRRWLSQKPEAATRSLALDNWDYAGLSQLVFGPDLKTYSANDRKRIAGAMETTIRQSMEQAFIHLGSDAIAASDKFESKQMSNGMSAVRCRVKLQGGLSFLLTAVMRQNENGEWKLTNWGTNGQMLAAMMRREYRRSRATPLKFSTTMAKIVKQPGFAYAMSVQALQGTLGDVRVAIELYKLQHKDRIPQLSQLQDNWALLMRAEVVPGKKAIGPYLKTAPMNPFTNSSKVVDATHVSLDAGWVYDERSGNISAIVPLQVKTSFGLSDMNFVGVDTGEETEEPTEESLTTAA